MYNNSDELVIILNAIESTCAVEFYTVVDTSGSPVHNTPCPLHWVRDTLSNYGYQGGQRVRFAKNHIVLQKSRSLKKDTDFDRLMVCSWTLARSALRKRILFSQIWSKMDKMFSLLSTTNVRTKFFKNIHFEECFEKLCDQSALPPD